MSYRNTVSGFKTNFFLGGGCSGSPQRTPSSFPTYFMHAQGPPLALAGVPRLAHPPVGLVTTILQHHR